MILIKCSSYNDGNFWGVIKTESEEEIEKIKKILEALKSYPDKWNWTNDIILVKKDEGWRAEKRVYDYYPSLDRSLIDWFSENIPDKTEMIEEIWLTEIKHEDRLL